MIKYVGGKRKATPEEVKYLNAQLEKANRNNVSDRLYGRPSMVSTTNLSNSGLAIR